MVALVSTDRQRNHNMVSLKHGTAHKSGHCIHNHFSLEIASRGTALAVWMTKMTFAATGASYC